MHVCGHYLGQLDPSLSYSHPFVSSFQSPQKVDDFLWTQLLTVGQTGRISYKNNKLQS